jgi:hypothetical protein
VTFFTGGGKITAELENRATNVTNKIKPTNSDFCMT